MIPCSLFDILKPYIKYSAKKYKNIVFKLLKDKEDFKEVEKGPLGDKTYA